MALKKCKECGNEVSTKAASCPKCGAVLKKKTGCLGYIGAAFLIFIILGVIGSLMNDDTNKTTPSKSTSVASKSKPQAEPSIAEKIVTIDAGRWGSVKQENVTRVQALLKQFTGNYNITETEVADKVVCGIHTLLRDKYGITQKLQDTMEDLNRVRFPKPQNGDFAKLVVVYVQMRNAGQSRTEAVNRLNAALALDNRALDTFLNQ